MSSTAPFSFYLFYDRLPFAIAAFDRFNLLVCIFLTQPRETGIVFIRLPVLNFHAQKSRLLRVQNSSCFSLAHSNEFCSPWPPDDAGGFDSLNTRPLTHYRGMVDLRGGQLI